MRAAFVFGLLLLFAWPSWYSVYVFLFIMGFKNINNNHRLKFQIYNQNIYGLISSRIIEDGKFSF